VQGQAVVRPLAAGQVLNGYCFAAQIGGTKQTNKDLPWALFPSESTKPPTSLDRATPAQPSSDSAPSGFFGKS
jgi:hypothetical protein